MVVDIGVACRWIATEELSLHTQEGYIVDTPNQRLSTGDLIVILQ